MRVILGVILLALTTSVVALVALTTRVAAPESWDREAAASYLDARADLWVTRSRTRQKLTTACISCHTAMPYLLLRAALGGSSVPQPAQDLYADVEARAMHWDDVKVWYDTGRGQEKPAQSWATESVLNALVLTMRDRRSSAFLDGRSQGRASSYVVAADRRRQLAVAAF